MVVLICCSEASRPRPDTSTRASLLTAAEQRAASEGTLRTGPPAGSGGWAGADLVLAAKLQALREEALRQLQRELQQREEANRRAALHLGAVERDARRKVLEQSGGAAGRGGSAQQQQPAGRVDAASQVMQLLGQRSSRVTPAMV